jgi:flagellar hook-associated protein 3 FlgL
MERITELMTTTQTLSNLSDDLNNLNSTEEELSSGKKINEPSDDPYGESVVISLNSQLSKLNSDSSNISDGTGWLNTASGALTDIDNMAERIRELTVEGANGTESASDGANAAAEVNQLIDEVKQAANTTYNGNYIFSGTLTTTAPYAAGANDTFNGNTAAITREVGPGASVQINTDVSGLLGSGGADGKLLSTLRSIASDLSSGSTTALGGTDLSALDSSLSTLEGIQSGVGALTNRLSTASASVQTMQTSDQTELAATEDANMATAATTYTTEQASYNAALQSGAQIVQESLLNFLSGG